MPLSWVEGSRVVKPSATDDEVAALILSNLSHELRTPLSVIMGTIPLFSEEIVGPLNEKQLGLMRAMAHSAQTLSTMVNDLLTMSEIQAGRLRLTMQPIDFPPLVAHVLRTMRPVAEASGQTLLEEVDDELPAFMGDAQHLTKVMFSLVGNAIRFTPGGGTICVQAQEREGSIRVAVLDTGIGLDSGAEPFISRPFGRLNPGRTRGLGLGLPISKALIEAHGGRVGVESRKGQGSTFWFTLPRPAAG